MKKHSKKLLIFAAVLTVFLTLGIWAAVTASPGSESDPLVSLSYVNDTLIPQLKAYVDEKISGIQSGSTSTQSGGYKLVELSQGQTVVAEKSTEMILRQGSGTIIATEKGGIADVTDGVDLANGTAVPSNHLLIVPFSDGRGISMSTDGILMIKGTYSLK